jgi:hypothetical protein
LPCSELKDESVVIINGMKSCEEIRQDISDLLKSRFGF